MKEKIKRFKWNGLKNFLLFFIKITTKEGNTADDVYK